MPALRREAEELGKAVPLAEPTATSRASFAQIILPFGNPLPAAREIFQGLALFCS